MFFALNPWYWQRKLFIDKKINNKGVKKMKNKLKKAMMSVSLAGAVFLTTSNMAFAAVDETQNPTGTKGECTVVYELGTSSNPGSSTTDGCYMVTIPKKITLGTDKTAAYTVLVTGDIASDKQVTVVPDATFLMKDVTVESGGKEDVTAKVTQEETIWIWSEVANGSEKRGSISAEDLTAGSWEGTFNFSIALEALN